MTIREGAPDEGRSSVYPWDRLTGGDVGLFLLRTMLGAIFLGHGLQKAGWFEGGGYATSISEQEQFLEFFGYSSTEFLAWVLTVTEIGTGVSLLVGLLTPLGAAGVIGVMFQFVGGPQWNAGLFGDDTDGGFEFAFAIMAGGLALAFLGAGRLSVDAWLPGAEVVRKNMLSVGLVASTLGLLVGLIVLEAWGAGLGGTVAPPG